MDVGGRKKNWWVDMVGSKNFLFCGWTWVNAVGGHWWTCKQKLPTSTHVQPHLLTVDGHGWTWLDLDGRGWTWVDVCGRVWTCVDVGGRGWTWMDVGSFGLGRFHLRLG